MNAMLEKILAVSKEIGPPRKTYAVIASRVPGNDGKSDFGKFEEMVARGVFRLPLCPVDFRISKTVDKVKKWNRLNRPPKVKISKKEVPAIMLMDIDSVLKPASPPELRWTPEPPKFEHRFDFGRGLGYRY